MLSLQFINAILISITAPAIGKLVDRIGEKGPLTFYSIGLIVVFLGYATFQTVGALYTLFLLDNVLFSFGVGFTVYLHRIVRLGELTPCLAMGTTMNHIAAVTVPVGGALLYGSPPTTTSTRSGLASASRARRFRGLRCRFLPAGPRLKA